MVGTVLDGVSLPRNFTQTIKTIYFFVLDFFDHHHYNHRSEKRIFITGILVLLSKFKTEYGNRMATTDEENQC